jgi:hypothetical protein
MQKYLLIAITTAAILGTAFGVQQITASSSSATANETKVQAIETVPLEGLSLDGGEFLLLADTTPAEIDTAHVAMNVPCEPDDADDDQLPQTDIAVVAGVAPNVSPVQSEFIAQLSDPNDNKCTYHVTLPEDGEQITDIAVINTSEETVEFDSGNFATISLTSADDDDRNRNDGNDDREDDD